MLRQIGYRFTLQDEIIRVENSAGDKFLKASRVCAVPYFIDFKGIVNSKQTRIV
jgi:hypothetical protein